MAKYYVTITKTLSRQIEVEAKDNIEAYEKTEQLYYSGDIDLNVLNSNIDLDIDVSMNN